MMKVSVCLLALVVATFAEPPSNQYLPPNGNGSPSTSYGTPRNGNGGGNGAPRPQYGAPNGNGGGYEDATEPASYQFEYTVQDAESGNDFGHMESREGDVAMGKYFVMLPDGRKQIVEYTADSDGYKPKISYEGGNGNGGGYPRGGNGGYPRNGNGGNGGYNY